MTHMVNRSFHRVTITAITSSPHSWVITSNTMLTRLKLERDMKIRQVYSTQTFSEKAFAATSCYYQFCLLSD